MTTDDSSEGDFLSQSRSAPAAGQPLPAAVVLAAAPPPAMMADNPGESGLGKKPAEAKPMRIGEKLMALGLISKDQLEIALREQAKSKKLLGSILISMNFITESALGEVLAESSGSERFDAKSTMLDSNLLAMVPREVCVRNKVIPVELSGTTVKLAMVDVYNVLAIDQVRRHLDKSIKIIPIFSTETEINELIERYYNYDLSIDGVLREIETGIRDKTQLDGREEGYINPTVRLVNALLVDAIKQGASDVHFEPEGSFLRLRYRIDGALQQIRSFHRDYWPAMLVRLKIMSGMNIAETRSSQDGRISMVALGREVDFRVATQPTVHGENVVLRILDKSKSLVPIEDLGFSEHNVELLKRCLKRPEGIIVVTGPTGSGKTTTLYSILGFINSIDVNIMTLEDPVEYQLPLIRQTNVREGVIDFHSGIKSLMRQDPDIIFLGEVRDEETAVMAVRAALTGHQVFTTLHTNDALGTIPRLSDIGVPPHLLAGSLICTMAQRLARKLCVACRKPRPATDEECRLLHLDKGKSPTVHEAVGCEKCGFKGYKGRVGLHEILRIDHGMDELIATKATRNQMLEYAMQNGFVPMVQDGISKVLAGIIDIPELINTVDLTDRL
ncbi:MAG: ATPase, T2SS/T4P/T4SS family [Alphaproteobacteria bacterium]|nr:ATPase, T2SS/T4P/T4SS family [Alphaproteobacteria bacterium]